MLSDCNKETLLIAIYPYYGNSSQVSTSNPDQWSVSPCMESEINPAI